MRRKGFGGILAGLSVFWGTSVWAQAADRGFIESPSAFVSGIGFISGWKCNSNDITLKVSCSPYIHDLDPAQNMLRSDINGRIDNGWIIHARATQGAWLSVSRSGFARRCVSGIAVHPHGRCKD